MINNKKSPLYNTPSEAFVGVFGSLSFRREYLDMWKMLHMRSERPAGGCSNKYIFRLTSFSVMG